jgi:2-hydroxy-6-oxonona-2,4-dienedioate hydrolase
VSPAPGLARAAARRETAASLVARLDALATKTSTPCGSGAMVWRTWNASASGLPLVLLHGAAGSWTHWLRNIPALSERRTVIAADLPGFGDSAMPPEPYTAESLADIVADGVRRVVPGRCDLLGFSFGAIIGGIAAARLGDRVRRLVLVAPNGMALPRPELPPLRRPGADPSREELRRVHRVNLGIMMLTPAGVDDVAVDLQIDNVQRARVRSGAIPDSDVLLHALPSITARMGGIWGERDALAAPYIDLRRAALERVQPDVDFRVVPGAGHWVLYEAPEAANAALLGMLAAEGE